MARMSREFTLVLLGAGLLTAGSFLWPDDPGPNAGGGSGSSGGGSDGTANNNNGRYVRTGTGPRLLIFPIITSAGPSPAAPRSRFVSTTGTTRSGFGSSGFRFSGS